MFGKPRPPGAQGLIPAGSRIEGQCLFTDSLRVDGEFHGDLRQAGDGPATLIVGESGVVHGTIEATHVIVHGKVQGPVMARDRLEVHAKGEVRGDLYYRMIELQPGASVTGQLQPLLGLDEQTRQRMAAAEPAVAPVPADAAGDGAAPPAREDRLEPTLDHAPLPAPAQSELPMAESTAEARAQGSEARKPD